MEMESGILKRRAPLEQISEEETTRYLLGSFPEMWSVATDHFMGRRTPQRRGTAGALAGKGLAGGGVRPSCPTRGGVTGTAALLLL